jgi:hypothetical protein
MVLLRSIPSFINISESKMLNVKLLVILAKQDYIEFDTYYVMNKG